MPSSFICVEDRVKRASQEGNLDACAERPRPMTVRKVWGSGMNGVGGGIGRMGMEWCRVRMH
jgi:hypothetical protein